MKLTATALRQVMDTLPNPSEQRSRERRIVLPPSMVPPNRTTDFSAQVECHDLVFTLNWKNEWELELDPNRELVKSLRFQLNEEKGISKLWKQEHLDLNKKYLLLMDQHEWLHKRWVVRWYFKYRLIIMYLKTKFK
jgi:hypothetical protein